MLDQFPVTEQAKAAFARTREAASALGHEWIGTEHLLLGLLRTERCIAIAALREVDSTCESLPAALLETLRPGRTRRESVALPFTPRAKRALELTLEARAALSDVRLHTGHFLLGLLHEPKGRAGRFLREHGFVAELILTAVQGIAERRGDASGGE